MSAIEDLLTVFLVGDHSPEEARRTAQDLLRRHARQLAKQIREDAQARHDRDFSDNRIFRLTGAQAAADLIDPEAQR
ncbi:hypothetical protein ACGFZR_24670 [Streptomyces sp. NPDC048241]|uniref:hypothetical protein n=1 Tax=Streptomyces sp. NPDC048241 TaxID=3365521 RepID=UPI003716C604